LASAIFNFHFSISNLKSQTLQSEIPRCELIDSSSRTPHSELSEPPAPSAPASIIQHPSSTLRPRRWLHRLLVLFAVLGLLLALAYILRAPLLTAFARAWIVDEKPVPADAIVVLGGGLECRPYAAAKLFKEGYAPKILIMDVAMSPTEQAGLKEPERDLTRKILQQQGVPDTAVEPVGRSVRNTFQESLGVRDWALAHNVKRLLITTDIFHTRRVKWLFGKQFKRNGIDLRVVAVQPWDYQSTNWWQIEPGLVAFQNEWVKLPYYWFKY
jgi:uncharacterized SAM-binding protein YcdF (DUF218 family)